MRSMMESERVFATFVGVRGVGRDTSWLSILPNEPLGLDVLDSVAVRRSIRLATLVDGFAGLVRSSFADVKLKRFDRSFAPFTGKGEARRWEAEVSRSVSERVRRLALTGFALVLLSWVEVVVFPILSSEADADRARSSPTESWTLDAAHQVELMCLLLYQADKRTWCLRTNRISISVLARQTPLSISWRFSLPRCQFLAFCWWFRRFRVRI